MLDEAVYNGLISQAFKRLVAAADKIDPDTLECDATGDMVTMTAPNGQKCIVNTQRAVRQIWVAGMSQGIHFSWNAERSVWLDDKGKGLELFAFVGEVVQSISGARLELPAVHG